MINETKSVKIRYKIAGSRRVDKLVFTKIKLPRIFKLPQIIQQIIMYYALLNNEDDRENEKIMVYLII